MTQLRLATRYKLQESLLRVDKRATGRKLRWYERWRWELTRRAYEALQQRERKVGDA